MGNARVTKIEGPEEPPTVLEEETVKAHGELNLLTDAGRWYLFAPHAWKTAYPTQPTELRRVVQFVITGHKSQTPPSNKDVMWRAEGATCWRPAEKPLRVVGP